MPGWLLLAVLVLWMSLPAHGEEFSARVIVVLDGDTVLALRACESAEREAPGTDHRSSCGGSRKVKIRLANIDAPEKSQDGGEESRQALAELVLHKDVRVSSQAVDGYGRTVATLGTGGMNVNEEQLRRGMAWEYSFHHRNRTYIALQDEARNAGRGLWAQPAPIPPWQWRKLHLDDAPTLPEHRQPSQQPGCGTKRYCSQMSSCAEARFYLAECGVRSLDQNRDGVPCESLCGAKHQDPASVPR